MLSFLLCAAATFATTATATPSWTQGYLAEYFHQCEPGSFVDKMMTDDSFEPELVCEDMATNGCDTLTLDFTNKKPGCQAWRGTECGMEGGFPGVNMPDSFSAKYTGHLDIPTTGSYEFCLDSDDGSKIWVDGTMVADDNSVHGMGWPECGTIDLVAGKTVTIQINYYENDGLAGLRLYWRVPNSVETDPVIIAPKYLTHSHTVDGVTSQHAGLRGEYFRQCHKHENIASLNLQQKQPVSHTVVKKREINYWYCDAFWCPDYVDPANSDSWKEDSCQEDPTVHESCVPYKDYFALRLTGYIVLNGIPAGHDSMNCTFRLTSVDGATFYLGDEMTTPLIDHDGLHDWWTDRSSEQSFVVHSRDIALNSTWPGGYIPFRVEYFNNNDEHALVLEMKGCHDMTTYSNFAPLRLTEFQLPADTDINATNPPDRQCKACGTSTGSPPDGGATPIDPSTVKGGCYPDAAAVDKSVMDLGRGECVQANKYLWCDQVLHPSTVGDGKCNPENNVLGCWDGGDCCQATCTDGIKHTCPLLPHDYPSCAATFLPGLDAEFYEDVSIGDVGALVERTVVPDIWWPSTGSEEGGPMEYFNSTGIVKEWNHFYIRLSGFIHIPDAGQYTFYLAADDGATLYIDGVRVLDNTGVHGMAVEQSPLWLSGGYHQLQVNMQQNVGDRGLQLEVRGPSYLDPVMYRKQPVPSAWLWNGNPCGDESSMGVDVPLDLRDLKVPRSPLCGGHGVCVPLCPTSNTHGACWNHTCHCDAGYRLSATSANGTGCELVPAIPVPPPPVNGWLVFVLVMLGLLLITASVCCWNRKAIKQWALWKFASARFYSSMKPALDHDDTQDNDLEDERERQPRHGMSQHRGGYEAAEI